MDDQGQADGSSTPTGVRQRYLRLQGADAAGLKLVASDIRSTSVTGCCALCDQEATLQLSHVFPRWSLRWMKQEGGPHVRIGSLGDVWAKEQDGAKHYMLCATCEQWLGDAENYLAKFCGSRTDLQSIGVKVIAPALLADVNEKLVLRGLLGILIKQHFSTAPQSRLVTIDRRLLASLKRRVLRDDYPPSYRVLAIKWLAFEIPGANPKALHVGGGLTRDGGGLVYDVSLGGFSWYVLLQAADLVAKKSGFPWFRFMNRDKWLVMVDDLTMNMLVNPDLADTYEELPWLTYASDAECPCGLFERSFATCCLDVWVSRDAEDHISDTRNHAIALQARSERVT